MKLPRRSFLAALFAPIAAKFFPKPSAHFTWTGFYKPLPPPRIISLHDVVCSPDVLRPRPGYILKMDPIDANRAIVTEYWPKDSAPFVHINGAPWPWDSPCEAMDKQLQRSLPVMESLLKQEPKV